MEEWLINLRNFITRQFLIVPNWLLSVVIITLVLGTGLRFTNLDFQLFSHDEAYTLLRVAGYTTTEVQERIFTGEIVTQNTLIQFQNLKPNSHFTDIINSLALEDPQHPPLYYLLARIWVQIWGSSIFTIRCFSAIISLAVFPAMYWLCRELFKVPHSTAIIAIALVAASPIQLLFAQEAQEYGLGMVTVLLASAALLRAIRLDGSKVSQITKIWSWVIYACLIAISLYTLFFSIFVVAFQGVYILCLTRFSRSRLRNRFATAVLIAMGCYLPWLIVILSNYDSFVAATAWTRVSVSRGELIASWLTQIRRIFLDFSPGLESEYGFIVTPFFVFLFGYGIYFLVTTTNPKIWGYMIGLIFVTAGFFLLSDITIGGGRSLAVRYMLTSYLGIEITIAYLLAHHIYNGLATRKQIWQGITIILLGLGLFSSWQIVQSDVWWHREINYIYPEIIQIINRTEQPVLISNDRGNNLGNILALSYSLSPETRYQLVPGNSIPRRVNQNSVNIFILNPSPQLLRGIEQEYQQTSSIRLRDRNTVLYQIQ